MSFTIWSSVRACVWIARKDDLAVADIPDGCTFAELAFIAEQEVNESDPNAFIVGVDDMTTLQLSRALDKRQRGMEPDTGWIERAKAELLGACRAGMIEMAGRPLCSDGGSQKIPTGIFSDVGFSQRGNIVSLEDADLRDSACWINLSLVAADVRAVWPKADKSKRRPGSGNVARPCAARESLHRGRIPYRYRCGAGCRW